jgi:thymidylate synthase (FAD)
MNVRLIASTVPCQFDGGPSTAEELIVYCARVSNPSNQSNMETAPRLLQYCIRHGHWSVFETASMTVEVETSRAIAAQLLRHRSFTFQEWSQRYAESTKFEEVELRLQDKKNRQASGELCDNLDLAYEVLETVHVSFDVYNRLIEAGVSRETARMVLPLCTQTRLYVTGCVRSWIHYFDQRCAEHTQKEHRELACLIREVFAKQFPNVWNALQLREAKP